MELFLDLRGVDKAGEDTWADCPAKAALENAMLDHAGEIVHVIITKSRKHKPKLRRLTNDTGR